MIYNYILMYILNAWFLLVVEYFCSRALIIVLEWRIKILHPSLYLTLYALIFINVQSISFKPPHTKPAQSTFFAAGSNKICIFYKRGLWGCKLPCGNKNEAITVLRANTTLALYNPGPTHTDTVIHTQKPATVLAFSTIKTHPQLYSHWLTHSNTHSFFFFQLELSLTFIHLCTASLPRAAGHCAAPSLWLIL